MSHNPRSLDATTPGVVSPFFLFLGALCLGRAAQFFLPRPVFSSGAVGYIAGAALIIPGLGLSTLTVFHFRRSKTPVSPLRPTQRLVVSGLYRFSRNPDYLGQGLVFAGIALVLNSVWTLLALIPALVLVRYVVIPREERYLQTRFGAEYASYCRRVRRWI